MPKHQEFRGNQKKLTVIDQPLVPMHTCASCGKQAYVSKADAKLMARRLHQGRKVRLHRCRGRNTGGSWHVTSMGPHATARYRDYEASGRKPYAIWNGDQS